MCVPYIIGDRLKPGNLKFQVLRKTTFKSVFFKFSIDPNTFIFSAYDLFSLRNNVVNHYCLPDEKQTKKQQKTNKKHTHAVAHTRSGGRLQLNTHAPYVFGLEQSGAVKWCKVVWWMQRPRGLVLR